MTIIGRHYEDETLIALIESADPETLARDPHLTSCDSCSDLAQTLRSISGALGHEDVWQTRELNETPRPETVANLRAFASDMAREDAVAERHLTELLAGPRETWLATLHAHPEYRTGGMVRKLVAATDHALDTMPPDAVAITELATEIADHLAPATYPTDTVSKLRGAAWRERAYALFYIGSYAEAETAICASERHFSDCVVSDYDLARDGLVRAMVRRAMDRVDETVTVTHRAAATFARYEDGSRASRARSTEAYLLLKSQDYPRAVVLLTREIFDRSSPIADEELAMLHTNVGFCYREMGRFEEALQHYQTALEVLTALELEARAVRVRWNIAGLLLIAGRLDDAYSRLSTVITDLHAFGYSSEVAVAKLEIVEILLATERYDEVDALCHEVVRYFQEAGVPYSSRVLVALEYMREAARKKHATPLLVRKVRSYVQRLPLEPHLLFLPTAS